MTSLFSLARMGHTLVTCDGNIFYMFGGYSLSQGVLNDLWKYDLSTDQWTQLLPATNDEPGARCVLSWYTILYKSSVYFSEDLFVRTTENAW